MIVWRLRRVKNAPTSAGSDAREGADSGPICIGDYPALIVDVRVGRIGASDIVLQAVLFKERIRHNGKVVGSFGGSSAAVADAAVAKARLLQKLVNERSSLGRCLLGALAVFVKLKFDGVAQVREVWAVPEQVRSIAVLSIAVWAGGGLGQASSSKAMRGHNTASDNPG